MEQTGTIVRRTKGFYYIRNSMNEIVECKIKGKLFKDSRFNNQSAVGDVVKFKLEGDVGLITEICERKSFLSRNRVGIEAEQVIAANVDRLIVTVAIKKPALRHNLICRLLVAAYAGRVKPVLLVTKIDLMEREKVEDLIQPYRGIGLDVIQSSIIEECDLSILKNNLIGNTSVLAGQSGVGKSSVLNKMFPSLNLKVGAVNKKTAKGSHTTTYASMHEIADNSYVIDTPGVREFGLWRVTKDNLREYFPKIKEYTLQCKHRDCQHVTEPGCAVKSAVENAEINPILYEGYLSIIASL